MFTERVDAAIGAERRKTRGDAGVAAAAADGLRQQAVRAQVAVERGGAKVHRHGALGVEHAVDDDALAVLRVEDARALAQH